MGGHIAEQIFFAMEQLGGDGGIDQGKEEAQDELDVSPCQQEQSSHHDVQSGK